MADRATKTNTGPWLTWSYTLGMRSQGMVAAVMQQQQQKAGVPSALLWNLQPSADGRNDSYTLTPSIIQSIMTQYPAGAFGRTAMYRSRAVG